MAPIKGCKYVLHTASPVVMAPPKGKVSNAPAAMLLCYSEESDHSSIVKADQNSNTQLQTEIGPLFEANLGISSSPLKLQKKGFLLHIQPAP